MKNTLSTMKNTLTIGQLADKTGVGIEAIRFYENKGLIPEPPRTAAGYRQYPDDSVNRICFIRHAKELGFSLKEIRELLFLRAAPKTNCTKVRKEAEHKRREIEQKITALMKMKNALDDLIDQCDGKTAASICPILKSLNAQEAS